MACCTRQSRRILRSQTQEEELANSAPLGDATEESTLAQDNAGVDPDSVKTTQPQTNLDGMSNTSI
jgi:hypothetical protein